MSEQQPEETTAAELPQGEDGLSPSEIRNHDFFKNVMKEKDSELRKTAEELNKLRERLDTEAKQKEIKEKEEQGKYHEIVAQLQAEKETVQQELQKQITTLKLETALAREGADEYFSSWAIQNYQGNDVAEYIESLKSDEKHAQRFNLLSHVEQGNPPPNAAMPASRSSGSWAQTKAELTSKDAGIRNAAHQRVKDYMDKTGKSPW